MKKTITIALIITILTATVASAGIFDATKDWLMDNALQTILTCLFTVVAGFFGGTIVGKLIIRAKLPIRELANLVGEIHKVRRADSPGGKTMTAAEKDAVLARVETLIAAVVAVFAKG